MNTHRAIRDQADDLQAAYSKGTRTINTDPSLTRQEQLPETDINTILNRFGVDTPMRRNGMFVEHDETIDLHQAMNAIRVAKQANYNLPPELQSKYPTWQKVLEGAESGQLEADLVDLKNKQEPAKREAEKQRKRQELELNRELEADMRAEAAAKLARAKDGLSDPKPQN